jgi:hypothetical protein
MANVKMMPPIPFRRRGEKIMDVLWGAWAKQVRLDERQDSVDIIGIYENIWKSKRSDFPFAIDLRAVVAYQANFAESNKTYQRTLTIMDVDATPIFTEDAVMTIPPVGDTPYRWYEEYEFRGVFIKEPAYYQLSVLINQEEKQVIPLWVIAPKQITVNLEDDSTTEEWAEQ